MSDAKADGHPRAFADVLFGPNDAKGDQSLRGYFLETPAYHEVANGRASFIIGRKGTGKTAIAEVLQQRAQEEYDLFSVPLSFKNTPTKLLYDATDDGFTAHNRYISLWKFLIAFETCKLVLQDESIQGPAKADLEAFLTANFGSTDVGCLDAISHLRETGFKVAVNVPWLKGPSGEVSRTMRDETFTNVHFGRAGVELLRRLGSLESASKYFLFLGLRVFVWAIRGGFGWSAVVA